MIWNGSNNIQNLLLSLFPFQNGGRLNVEMNCCIFLRSSTLTKCLKALLLLISSDFARNSNKMLARMSGEAFSFLTTDDLNPERNVL